MLNREPISFQGEMKSLVDRYPLPSERWLKGHHLKEKVIETCDSHSSRNCFLCSFNKNRYLLFLATAGQEFWLSIFISYARKPQAFKPGDEWHPFEAKPGETWRSGANSDMIWLWPNIRLGPIRNTACSTTWCGYRNIVGVYCEAKWSSA